MTVVYFTKSGGGRGVFLFDCLFLSDVWLAHGWMNALPRIYLGCNNFALLIMSIFEQLMRQEINVCVIGGTAQPNQRWQWLSGRTLSNSNNIWRSCGHAYTLIDFIDPKGTTARRLLYWDCNLLQIATGVWHRCWYNMSFFFVYFVSKSQVFTYT